MRGKILSGILSVGLLSAALIAGCGGGGLGSDTGSTTGSTSATACASLSLLASSPVLPSAASTAAGGTQLTALCRDSSNNYVTGATIVFSASAGGLSVTQGTTDSSGSATAILTTAGDAANRQITVSASNSSAKATLILSETGTTISISGPTTVGFGATGSYKARLVNSAGTAIAYQPLTISATLNSVSPTSATTDSTGYVSFTYSGTSAGSDSIAVSSSALNATSASSVTVATYYFGFPTASNPAQDSYVKFATPTTIVANYSISGLGVSGINVNFATTRGTLALPSGGSSSTSLNAKTDSSGNATVVLSSDGTSGAGGELITAIISDTNAANNGASASLPLVFLATTPAIIFLNASPTTITPYNSSSVTATVLDAKDNLVANQLVNFSLVDASNGSLSAASVTTDSTGTATVTYTASANTSATNGVAIDGTVASTPSVTTLGGGTSQGQGAKLTVGGKALFITLGTGNTLAAKDQTTYALPYTAYVVDSGGNPPAAGTAVNLVVKSLKYYKGIYSNGSGAWKQITVATCSNEDSNYNGILDPGEDFNNNTKLDPGEVALVPSSVTLDSGLASFDVLYPKDHAYWVRVELQAAVTVAGSESTATADFDLPGLASDYSDVSVAPPGLVSPYGTSPSCSNPS